jgi:hypothetical protein
VKILKAYNSPAREGAHLTTLGVYAGTVATVTMLARARGASVPSISAWDTARMALATYKGARLLSKDKVTAPLRAPFTQRAGDGEANEVNDQPRGDGARETIGELMSCPFCIGQWLATALTVGLIFAPRGTRLVASTLAATAGADFLHHAYCAAQQLPGKLSR